jgi:hypothetical protein
MACDELRILAIYPIISTTMYEGTTSIIGEAVILLSYPPVIYMLRFDLLLIIVSKFSFVTEGGIPSASFGPKTIQASVPFASLDLPSCSLCFLTFEYSSLTDKMVIMLDFCG